MKLEKLDEIIHERRINRYKEMEALKEEVKLQDILEELEPKVAELSDIQIINFYDREILELSLKHSHGIYTVYLGKYWINVYLRNEGKLGYIGEEVKGFYEKVQNHVRENISKARHRSSFGKYD